MFAEPTLKALPGTLKQEQQVEKKKSSPPPFTKRLERNELSNVLLKMLGVGGRGKKAYCELG